MPLWSNVGVLARAAVAVLSAIVLCTGCTGGSPTTADSSLVHPNLLHDCADLRPGASGACVVELRRLLAMRGGSALSAGTFDSATAATVGQFQGARGLTPTGVVDAVTKQALYDRPDDTVDWDLRTECVDLRAGASGTCVRSLQHLLRSATGAALVDTGDFGPNTDAAVREFQHSMGAPADGVVGVATKKALYGRYFAKVRPVDGPVATGATTCPRHGFECDVYLSRATTAAVDDWLDTRGGAMSTVGSLVSRAACLILTRKAATTRCEQGANLAGDYVIGQVADARQRNWCLRVNMLEPAGYQSFVPVGVYADDDARHCPD